MILFGKQGIGKSLFAKTVAQDLLAISGQSLELNAHPDFKLIERIENKELSIDQIRELKEFARKTPAIAELKIVIIDDIDFMNKYTANALLKILEEPPFNLIILLISHQIHTVLPTIKSRTAKLKFEITYPEAAATILQANYQISSILAEELLKISNNSLGMALKLNQNGILEQYKKILTHFPYIEPNLQQELEQFNDELIHFLLLRIARLVLGTNISERYYLPLEIEFSTKFAANTLITTSDKLELWNNINNYFMDLKFSNLDRKHIFYLIFNHFKQLSI